MSAETNRSQPHSPTSTPLEFAGPRHYVVDGEQSGDQQQEQELLNEEASKMVEVAVEAATERKAHGGVVLTVTGLCSYADFILILSAESDRQVQAISERIDQAMRDHEWRPLGTEGVGQGGWALLDYGDLVVHVFRDDLRDFYDLEGLWVEAPRAEIIDGEIVETSPQEPLPEEPLPEEPLPEEPLEDDPDDG